MLEGHESNYLLKMVQQVLSRGETNGVKDISEDYIGVGDEHAMTFDIKEVIDLAVESVGFNARDDSQNGDRPCLLHHFLVLNILSRLQYKLPYRHRHFWKSDCS